jgi:hypothetical protein
MVLSRAVLLGMNVQHLPPTLWDPDGIYVDMVREDLGYWNSRVKGIANWTKVQVPLHLTRRVSNKGPPQYHQMFAWATVRVDWLPNFPKKTWMCFLGTLIPPPPWEVVIVLGWGSNRPEWLSAPLPPAEFLTMENSIDKVIQDSLPQTVLFMEECYYIFYFSRVWDPSQRETGNLRL